MIKLIIGKKGSGKTKKLVDMVNDAAQTSLGNVVCIEKGDTLTYSVTHKARLIDAESYGISGYGERTYDKLSAFLERISSISDVEFIFTVSADKEELPKKIFDLAEIC